MNERLHIHKKADSSASAPVLSQFQSRPFIAQAQPQSQKPLTQTEIENQEFQQHKFEATKLEIQAKYGTITPLGQEQLTVLQAKMSGLLQRRVENASRFGHNLAKIALMRPDTPPPQSIQQKVTSGKPEELNQETFIDQSFPPPLQMQPLSMGGGLPIREPLVQPKLTIGQPGDKYEQEADRVASQVVNQINAPAPQQSAQSQSVQREAMPDEEDELMMKPEISTIQREEVPEEKEELQMKPMLQLQPSGDGMAVAPDLEATIQQTLGSGQPLADNIREPMEQAFGANFGGVKVHTDAQSEQLNQLIQARAFTTGQDIFFRQGEYNPGSKDGQELIAHELTHVMQQNSSAVERSQSQETTMKTKESLDTTNAVVQGMWWNWYGGTWYADDENTTDPIPTIEGKKEGERIETRSETGRISFEYKYDTHGDKHFTGKGSQWSITSNEAKSLMEDDIKKNEKVLIENSTDNQITLFYMTKIHADDIGKTDNKKTKTYTIQIDVDRKENIIGYHGYPVESATATLGLGKSLKVKNLPCN